MSLTDPDLAPFLDQAERELKKDGIKNEKYALSKLLPFDYSLVLCISNLPALKASNVVGAKAKILAKLNAYLYAAFDRNYDDSALIIPQNGETVVPSAILRCNDVYEVKMFLNTRIMFSDTRQLDVKRYSDILDAINPVEKPSKSDEHYPNDLRPMVYIDNKRDSTPQFPYEYPLGFYTVNLNAKPQEKATQLYPAKEAATQHLSNHDTFYPTWSPSGKYMAFYLKGKGVKIISNDHFGDVQRILGLKEETLKNNVFMTNEKNVEVDHMAFSPCENYIVLFFKIGQYGSCPFVYRINAPNVSELTLVKDFRPESKETERYLLPFEKDFMVICSVFPDTDKIVKDEAESPKAKKPPARALKKADRKMITRKITFWNNVTLDVEIDSSSPVSNVLQQCLTLLSDNLTIQNSDNLQGITAEMLKLVYNKKEMKLDTTFADFDAALEEQTKDEPKSSDDKKPAPIIKVEKRKRVDILAKIEKCQEVIDEKFIKRLEFTVSHGLDRYLVTKVLPFQNPGKLKFSFDGKFAAQIVTPGFLNIYDVEFGFSLLDKFPFKIENIVDFEWSPAAYKEPKKVSKSGAVDTTVALKEPSNQLKLSEYVFAYWSPGTDNGVAGRFCVMNLEKTNISTCDKLNSELIVKGDIYWQNEGDYVALVVRDAKSNSVFFCRICEDKCPSEQFADLNVKLNGDQEGIISFNWEPYSHRFLVQRPNEIFGKYDYYFYQMRTPVKELIKGQTNKFNISYKNDICLINYIKGSKCGHSDSMVWNTNVTGTGKKFDQSVFWSPRGKHLALTNVSEQTQFKIKFFEVDETLVHHSPTSCLPAGLKEIGKEVEPPAWKRQMPGQYRFIQLSWDPSGRMLAAVYVLRDLGDSMEKTDAVNFYTFQGKPLSNATITFPLSNTPIREFLWRPLRNDSEMRRLRKTLPGSDISTEYIKSFIAEEEALERKAKAERIASRMQHIVKYLSFVKASSNKRAELLQRQIAHRCGYDENNSSNYILTSDK